ncbi:MAG TPA: type II toxin-antitoxin system RelE/ParE family toxin [Deltaproteobacteria bacterium]|nr:type II toxin-antitoxin system RelE/ParE family toxin [Deltaproteobacteria bacterium]
MRTMKLRFTPEAARLISKLHPESKKLIRAALDELRSNPFLGAPLESELRGYRSLKAKRYRVVYKVNEEEGLIDILYVGHRRSVYEEFRQLLIILKKDQDTSKS